MKLLRRLNVFGKVVPVFKVDGLLRGEAAPDVGPCLGFYTYADDGPRIAVESTLQGEELQHTILHEMFHAVLDRVHVQQQLPPALVEVIVETLAVSVVDNFKLQNKK